MTGPYLFTDKVLLTWQRWTYYSQWLIAIGAAAQCWQTGIWLRLPPVSLWLILFVFCSTLLLYLFHFRFYRIKQPLNDRQHFFVKYRMLLSVQFVVGAVVLGISFFKTGIHFLIPLLVLALCAVAYTHFINKPRHQGIFRYNGIFKILTLTFVWMAVTSVLPVAASGRAMFTPACLLYYCLRWVLMIAICLPFDIRDMHQDKQRGNNTLPVLIGAKYSFLLCYSCLLLHALLPFAGLAEGWYGSKVVFANVVATLLTAYCTYYASRNLKKDFSWFLLDSNLLLRAIVNGSALIF